MAPSQRRYLNTVLALALVAFATEMVTLSAQPDAAVAALRQDLQGRRARLMEKLWAGSMAILWSAPARVYVPHLKSNDVYVIDPATLTVVDRFKMGTNPQHVVPSWDLTTLWVTNNAEGRTDGSLTPIDPVTAKPGKAVAVDDPYNMYFTPDGRSAVVVAEALRLLDFRDPKTRALQDSMCSTTAATSAGAANEPASLSVSRIVTGRPVASAT